MPRRAYLLSLLSFTLSAALLCAQEPAKAPKLSREQIELFLKTATIQSQKVMDVGVTRSSRATLTDGQITHDAHIQFVNIFRPTFRGKEGTVEKNFRDSYKFNIAAYELDKLLALEMIPPSVEREVDGKPAAVTWWADDVLMTEEERRLKQVKAPADQAWVDQLNKIRVFDQLIYNTDRNQGNLLITNAWKVLMIDHTRAFRVHPTLQKADSLTRCDFQLLDSLRKLNQASMQKVMSPYLRPEEISGVLARRDLIVKHFEKEIIRKGDDAVLTGIPRKTPAVSLP